MPVPGMAVGPQTIARLASFKLRENDIVMARRGEMGRCAIVSSNERGWLCGTGSLILRLSKCVFQPFIVLLIGSPLVREYLSGTAVGATMQNLNQGILLNLVIALPPLAEQRRIVAKVGELMALSGRLEAARAEQDMRRNTLVAAANHNLMNASDLRSCHVAARFYLKNLSRLTATNEHVTIFRKTILHLAIKGRLVLHASEDDLASELPERTQEGKSVRSPVLQTQVKISPNPPEGAGLPFGLPSNWRWVPLDAVLDSSFYGPRFGAGEYSQMGVPTIRTTDMTIDGRIVLRDPPMVSAPAERLNDFKCQKGDLLITRTGSIGVMAVFKGDYLAIPSAYLIRLRFTSGVLVDYIHTVMRSPYGQSSLGLNTTKVAQPNINAKNLRAILIPLPPRAEQNRIVARVDTLMKLCDDLEARITSDAEVSRELLEVVLSKALGINEISEGRGFDVDRRIKQTGPPGGGQAA